MGIHESSLVLTRGVQSAAIFKKYNFLAQINFYKKKIIYNNKEISHPNRGYYPRAQKLIDNTQNPISTIHNEESRVMNIHSNFSLIGP
jgi:hypothetical protein